MVRLCVLECLGEEKMSVRWRSEANITAGVGAPRFRAVDAKLQATTAFSTNHESVHDFRSPVGSLRSRPDV